MCGADLNKSQGKAWNFICLGYWNDYNNWAKAYVLYQGILLAKEARINSLTIIWDSSIIINLMAMKLTISNRKLASTIAWIQNDIRNLHKVWFYQVLQAHNHQCDSMSNEAVTLKVWVLRKMRGGTFTQFLNTLRFWTWGNVTL
jgi:hypothetical protein